MYLPFHIPWHYNYSPCGRFIDLSERRSPYRFMRDAKTGIQEELHRELGNLSCSVTFDEIVIRRSGPIAINEKCVFFDDVIRYERTTICPYDGTRVTSPFDRIGWHRRCQREKNRSSLRRQEEYLLKVKDQELRLHRWNKRVMKNRAGVVAFKSDAFFEVSAAAETLISDGGIKTE